MRDLIERQKAIDAVEHITSSMSVCVNTDECHGMKRMQRQAVIELANLPSAQPEIIRCKDCEHFGVDRHKKLTWCSRINYGYGYQADDFCSKAERRTNEAD